MRQIKMFSEVLLLCLISSTIGDPSPAINTSSKTRGLFDGLFGYSQEQQPVQLNSAGVSPCFPVTTTTTQSPMGPLCPLQQLPNEDRPFETRPLGSGPPPVLQLPALPPAPTYPEQPPYPPAPQYPPPPPAPQYPPYPQPPPAPQYPPPPPAPQYPTAPEYPKPPPQPEYPAYPPPPPAPQYPPAPEYPKPPPQPEYPAYPPPPPAPQYPTAPEYPKPPPQPEYPAYPPGPPPPQYPPQPEYPTYPPATVPTIPTAPPLNVPGGKLPNIIQGHFFPGNPPYTVQPQPGYYVPSQGQFFPDPAPSHSIDPGFGVHPNGPVGEPSTLVPVMPGPLPFTPLLQSCAGIPVGPLIPPGFFIANSYLRQQYYMSQHNSVSSSSLQLCNMVDVLQQLRLVTIYNLIQQAGLEQLFTQTSNYTFFAPVDPAFEKLPAWFMQSLRDDIKLLRAFILNHFIKIEVLLESLGNEFLVMNARAGGNRLRINVYNEIDDYRIYTVDGSRILLGEMQTSNGILHVVDKVLVPTSMRLHSEYLAQVQDFSAFLSTVVDSGLLPLLEDKNSPITLFVPYNEAFKGFDYAAIANDVPALQNLVNYHIVNGTYYSAGLLQGQYLTTNYYKEIKMSVTSDGFTKYANSINGIVKILKADIPCVNGVVHIIDTVLTYDVNFFTNIEMSEFTNEFGVLRRGMTLNKAELEKEFANEGLSQKTFNETN